MACANGDCEGNDQNCGLLAYPPELQFDIYRKKDLAMSITFHNGRHDWGLIAQTCADGERRSVNVGGYSYFYIGDDEVDFAIETDHVCAHIYVPIDVAQKAFEKAAELSALHG